MSAQAGGTTVLLVGVLLLRLALTDAYQRYVRVGMGPWLVAAGGMLAVLGLVAVLAALRRPGSAPAGGDHETHHGHAGMRVGWLLLAPVVALLMVTPPALGSFGVNRSVVSVGGSGATFDPLPATGAPRPMTLLEFDQRAADRRGASMSGVTLRLTGFVARPRDHGGVQLARYQIACCAADAVAAVVRVLGVSGVPARDGWLTVVGTFRGMGPDGVPELAATSAQSLAAPVDPYE